LDITRFIVSFRAGVSGAPSSPSLTLWLIAHVLLAQKVNYRDLGPDYFPQLNRKVIERRCVRQLEKLSYRVTSTEAA
jgi:hypothetical protein